MSDAVVADFVARYAVDTAAETEPETGRIVLGRKGVVLAGSDDRLSIPFGAVFDITVGHVPPDLTEFFRDTVTIAYERGDDRRVAMIESGSDEVDRFTTLLFKAMLNGAETRIRHPARVGGRVTDARFRPATLRISPGSVTFRGESESVSIDLATVTHFEKSVRDVGGGPRSVLGVRHTADGQAVTTEFAVGTERKLNLLGRYLRLEYRVLVERAAEIDATAEEMEALVAIYSGGGASALAGVLGADANYVSMLLDSLREKELVAEDGDGLSLTAQGRMLVSDRIEDVNA